MSDDPPPSSSFAATLHFLTSLTTGVLHAALQARLPALHGSLPASMLCTLLPPVAFLFTALLPRAAALPPLFVLALTHRAALPSLDLAATWLIAGSVGDSTLRRLLVALAAAASAVAAPILPATFLDGIAPYVPGLLIASALVSHVESSHWAAAFRIRLAARVPSKSTGRRRRKSQKALFLQSFARLPKTTRGLCLYVLAFIGTTYVTGPGGAVATSYFYPRHMPKGFAILAQARGPTGLISVVQYEDRYRLLTADLSVLGGRHIDPRYHRDSIFEQFHVHEAVRLALRSQPDDRVDEEGSALCIGMGVGIVANGLHRIGVKVDAVEIDPFVAKYARKYFGMTAPHVHIMDALRFLDGSQGHKKDQRYDYVIHDVFTGCAVPAKLFAMSTWRAIRAALKPDGVLAVNFVGAVDDAPATASTAAVALVHDRLQKAFGHVRMFSDGDDISIHNIVFFASPIEQGVQFREPVFADFLDSGLRQEALEGFQKHEIDRQSLGPLIEDVEGGDWVLHMGQWDSCRSHVELMHTIHPKTLWPALFAHEQLR